MKFSTKIQTLALAGLVLGAQAQCKPAAEGSTNLGNGDLSASKAKPFSQVRPDSLIQWCGDRVGLIDTILESERMAILEGRSLLEIDTLLEDGLVQLSKGFVKQEPAYSFTQRSIIRGIEITTALKTQLGDTEEWGLRTRKHFMEQYYGFIRDVAMNLDIPYYIPYYNRGSCQQDCLKDFSEEAFTQKILQYSSAELGLVLDVLATSAQYTTYSRGDTQAFLTVLEFTAKNTSEDLGSSLAAAQMACVIVKLDQLNAKLATYNSGDHSVYAGSEVLAFRLTYAQATAIKLSIDQVLNGTQTSSCQDGSNPYITPHDGHGYPLPPYVTPQQPYITPKPSTPYITPRN